MTKKITKENVSEELLKSIKKATLKKKKNQIKKKKKKKKKKKLQSYSRQDWCRHAKFRRCCNFDQAQ